MTSSTASVSGADPFWQDAIKLGLSFTLAGLSWRFLEKPIMAIGRTPMIPERPANPAGTPTAKSKVERVVP